ncbi:Protein GVQW1, partial [Plecturocebus cupreus]
MRFHRVGQAALKLLTSGHLPTLASQSARITGVSHPAWPIQLIFISTYCVLSAALNPKTLQSTDDKIRQSLALSPRLEWSGLIIAHCSLELLASSDLPASAPQSTGIIGRGGRMQKHSWEMYPKPGCFRLTKSEGCDEPCCF